MSPQLYLASNSPRRQELLRQIGVGFETLAVAVPERPAPGELPDQYAVRMALAKARAGAALAPQPLPVLGADTDVVAEDRILGKPADREAGIDMLLRLSARTHRVYSAVALVHDGRAETSLSMTRVAFAEITPAQAAAYWDTGEPAGKAGGYAIQGLGARFVREIWGSYSAVMGLPLFETCELLQRFGLDVLDPDRREPRPAVPDTSGPP